MAVLGYLAKLKRGLGLAFEAHFLHGFSINVPYLVAMSHLISFSRYQTKYVIKFLFRQVMNSKILRSFLDQSLRQWLTGKIRGEDENTKI